MSHTVPFFPTKSGLVMTEDGGKSWKKVLAPFQISGPLLFHPREENWILARAVINGRVRSSQILFLIIAGSLWIKLFVIV